MHLFFFQLSEFLSETSVFFHADGLIDGGRVEVLGLYRVRDTDGDDQFDEVRLLRKLAGIGAVVVALLISTVIIWTQGGNPMFWASTSATWSTTHPVTR